MSILLFGEGRPRKPDGYDASTLSVLDFSRAIPKDLQNRMKVRRARRPTLSGAMGPKPSK